MKQRQPHLLPLLPLLTLTLLLPACGYRLKPPQSELVAGLESVHVPIFDNRTAEPGAELFFTTAAREQLERAGRLGAQSSPGTLRGTLVAVSGAPFGLQSPDLPRQPFFRLTVTLNLVLEKGGVVVGSASVTTSEEFPSGADILLTEANRGTALRRVAELAVREGLERLQAPRD